MTNKAGQHILTAHERVRLHAAQPQQPHFGILMATPVKKVNYLIEMWQMF